MMCSFYLNSHDHDLLTRYPCINHKLICKKKGEFIGIFYVQVSIRPLRALENGRTALVILILFIISK